MASKRQTPKEKWVAEKLEESSCIFWAQAEKHVQEKQEGEWYQLVENERQRLLDQAEEALGEHWDNEEEDDEDAAAESAA